MGNILGLDTGGTFTDAAIIDAVDLSVVKTSKSLTTRHDLSVGVGNAMRIVLGIEEPQDQLNYTSGTKEKLELEAVELVCLSTTLATNSIVENAGSHVALVLIGFDKEVLNHGKLGDVIGQNPVLFIDGGHKSDGTEKSPLNTKALIKALKLATPKVSAFAVASYFATRNPEHEIIARNFIREHAKMPVSCSHELSASLGGPKRALTAFLNAKLISLIEKLINATQQQMDQIGLNCKLMVVKGDGSLVSADFARERPVETILSGPAASVSGASFLAKEKTAIVCDIGGTTTDVAILKNGSAELSVDGAKIGGWNTMVEAVKIWTSGLGGDSEMHVTNKFASSYIKLGPRRALPLSLLGEQFPECIAIMEQQLLAPIALATDARFVIPLFSETVPSWLGKTETKMANRLIKSGISAIADVADTQVALGAIDRLISKGLVQLSCFTPTDAAHILGRFDKFNKKAATIGAQLFARQKDSKGHVIAKSIESLSMICLNNLSFESAVKIADALIAEDTGVEDTASKTPAIKETLSDHSKKTRFLQHHLSLSTPIIALGASARTHYPQIAKRFNTSLIIPDFAAVAGAIGAAIGSIIQQSHITVTQPQQGVFRVHLADGIEDFSSLGEAIRKSREAAQKSSEQKAKNAGASKMSTILSERIQQSDLGNGNKLFIEAVITARTSGNTT